MRMSSDAPLARFWNGTRGSGEFTVRSFVSMSTPAQGSGRQAVSGRVGAWVWVKE